MSLPAVNVPERLKSRKLWVAILGAAYFALSGDLGQSEHLLLAYLGVQGVADILKVK